MDGYIVTKKVTMNGKSYAAGEIIPAEAVLPSRVPALLRTKTIVEIPETQTSETEQLDAIVSVPIAVEDGTLMLNISGDDIAKAVEILQMSAEDAVTAIADVYSGDTLIVINACDSRKTVKKAAQARSEELVGETDEESETVSETETVDEETTEQDGEE